MTRYTQESLNKLLRITSEGEWMPSDTLELIGSIGGYPAKLTHTLPDSAYDANADYTASLLASLEVIDFKLPLPGQLAGAAPAVAAPRPSGGQTTQSRQQNNGGASTGGCPEHGTTKQRPGFGGRGFECGAWSDQPEPWTKPGRLMNDGRTVYYCASKW